MKLKQKLYYVPIGSIFSISEGLRRARSQYVREWTSKNVQYIKSDNLQYNTLSLGRWDKQLIDQASDIPSIIFFHNF